MPTLAPPLLRRAAFGSVPADARPDSRVPPLGRVPVSATAL